MNIMQINICRRNRSVTKNIRVYSVVSKLLGLDPLKERLTENFNKLMNMSKPLAIER